MNAAVKLRTKLFDCFLILWSKGTEMRGRHQHLMTLTAQHHAEEPSGATGGALWSGKGVPTPVFRVVRRMLEPYFLLNRPARKASDGIQFFWPARHGRGKIPKKKKRPLRVRDGPNDRNPPHSAESPGGNDKQAAFTRNHQRVGPPKFRSKLPGARSRGQARAGTRFEETAA